jgi:hypothetical protein
MATKRRKRTKIFTTEDSEGAEKKSKKPRIDADSVFVLKGLRRDKFHGFCEPRSTRRDLPGHLRCLSSNGFNLPPNPSINSGRAICRTD